MKILALEEETPGVKPEQFLEYLKSEAKKIWELYQEGIIREFYFRGEPKEAVLIMEATSMEEANQVLGSLPLVQAGLITFEVIPLIPYTGFSRLFV